MEHWLLSGIGLLLCFIAAGIIHIQSKLKMYRLKFVVVILILILVLFFKIISQVRNIKDELEEKPQTFENDVEPEYVSDDALLEARAQLDEQVAQRITSRLEHLADMCHKVPFVAIPRKLGRGERPTPAMSFTSKGVGVCTAPRAGSDFMFDVIRNGGLTLPISNSKDQQSDKPSLY